MKGFVVILWRLPTENIAGRVVITMGVHVTQK